MSLVKYWGIADCNGLQSFIKISQALQAKLVWDKFSGITFDSEVESQNLNSSMHGAVMSCRHNSQRHSVVYKIEIEESDAKEIEIEMKTNSISALMLVKAKSKEIALAKDVPGAKGMWDKIPNPDLDPF